MGGRVTDLIMIPDSSWLRDAEHFASQIGIAR